LGVTLFDGGTKNIASRVFDWNTRVQFRSDLADQSLALKPSRRPAGQLCPSHDANPLRGFSYQHVQALNVVRGLGQQVAALPIWHAFRFVTKPRITLKA
jgi:hypothetical protein